MIVSEQIAKLQNEVTTFILTTAPNFTLSDEGWIAAVFTEIAELHMAGELPGQNGNNDGGGQWV